MAPSIEYRRAVLCIINTHFCTDFCYHAYTVFGKAAELDDFCSLIALNPL